MRERYSKPSNFVIYNHPMQHFRRVFFARITATNSAARSATFDRTFPKDFFVDEKPQMRMSTVLGYCGLQDLTIETATNTVTLGPVQFQRAANCWMKGVDHKGAQMVRSYGWYSNKMRGQRQRLLPPGSVPAWHHAATARHTPLEKVARPQPAGLAHQPTDLPAVPAPHANGCGN